MFARLLALPLVLVPLLPWSGAGDAPSLEDARAKFEAEEFEPAAKLLSDLVASDGQNAEVHQLLGSVLLRLDRNDEAAHHMEAALNLLTDKTQEKVARELKARLYRTDPLARSRDLLFTKITDRIVDAAEKLSENGSTERALELLTGVLPIARGKNRDAAEKLYEKIASAFEEVDLNAAGTAKGEGGWPLHEASSVRYELSCNLEPEVVQLIGETMDSIYDYYVSLYFDGDDSEIKQHRATIRIHPTKADMLGDWQGESAPEGWWSPGSSEVVSFDTRTSSGTLDDLLETLFHEASHQFMTLMSKGGRSPTWLNEGTSCFFEGAIAMADNRVLWPDAAIGRLVNLKGMIEHGGGPTPRQVIEYQEPGSYAGNYYAFGWGYVYFLQQYEDPETLEYVYRPLYAKYRDTVTTKPSNSMELFEEVFLGKKSPRKHETFEEFEKDWIDWIVNQVAPLHLAKHEERRTLRLEKVERYLAAANEAQGNKKAKVSEAELLRRALGHLEYVRTRIDGEEAPDAELVLQQATILERLDFKKSAAPLLELWLTLAEGDTFEADEEVLAAVEKRLKAIDSKNYDLRRARNKVKELIKLASKLLAKYEKTEDMPLRTYTFAAHITDVFKTESSFAEDAERLKRAAREAGVLRGVVRSLTGPEAKWHGHSPTRKPKKLKTETGSVALRSRAPNAQINTSLELSGEYELRTQFTRVGKIERGSGHGIVIAGTTEGDWLVVGLSNDGRLAVWQIIAEGEGPAKGMSFRRPDKYDLSEPLPDPKDPEAGGGSPIPITIHVLDPVKFTVTVGDSEPINLEYETDIPAKRFAGMYVDDGELLLTDFVVEIFP